MTDTTGLTFSQNGGGFSWYIHSNFNRINRWFQDLIKDDWGKFIFVKDTKRKKFWSLTYKPAMTRFKRYEVKHSFGFSEVNTVYDNKRLRYRNNTKPGSSGSPVFDMNWNLVALHHGGYPTKRDLEKLKEEGKPVPDGFNQGIPVNLTNDFVVSKGHEDFFG